MSVFLPSNVLDQFATNIEAVANASPRGGKFTRSAYRFTLEKEADSSRDGLYFLQMQSVDPRLRRWGDGSNITDSIVVVRIVYGRAGGSLGGGDRQTVMRNAADDCVKMADVCENPANYGSSTSGIRIITFDGARPTETNDLTEIWEVRFKVQWESDMDTTTVVDLTKNSIVLDGINTGSVQLVAYAVNSLDSGSKAFVKSVWASFTLDRTDVQTPDNVSIVRALPPGSGNWLRDG